MSTIPAHLLLQCALILLTALFTSAESSIVSLNAGKLRKLEEEGDQHVKQLVKLINTPARFLSAMQTGALLSGLLGSAFAAVHLMPPLSRWLYEDMRFTFIPYATLRVLLTIFITLIMCFFTLVLGQLLPKRIASQKPLVTARLVLPAAHFLSHALHPIAWLANAVSGGLLRIMRLKEEPEEETVTEDEIRMMVDLGEEKGTIDADEKKWIQNVFEFGDTSVRDAMTRQSDIEALSIHADHDQILALIRETGLSRFPVYGRDINDILGILNVRDYLLKTSSGSPCPLADLIRPAYFVPETIHADQLFKDMQTKKIHIAIVIDEYGETGGIITMEDLLEEIVGNIYDEFDRAEPQEIEQLEENLWRVSGSVDIKTLGEALNTEIPESDDYETLGGMIFSCLHTIPRDGTTLDVEINGLSIHVEKVAERRIKEALVRKLPPSQSDSEDDESRKESST